MTSAIVASGVGKCFLEHSAQPIWALRDISLNVEVGQAVAVMGRNGSGKSTLLQVVAGTLAPTTGQVEIRGRVGALLELGSGFNPELTGRDNVVLSGAMLGHDRKILREQYDAICEFADIGDYIDRPVKRYSSGMFVRLAFAVHAVLDPDVLIVDEALAVGDLAFQRKCLRLLESRLARGRAVLVASHDPWLVHRICQRAIVLDAGRVVVDDAADVAVERYLSEYAVSHGVERPPTANISVVRRVPIASRGGAVIEGIAVDDAAGKPSRTFRNQQEMRVTCLFRSETRVRMCSEVRIEDASGWLVWASGLEPSIATVPEPDRTYRHVVDISLNLGPGRYFISCALWDLDTREGPVEVDLFKNAVEVQLHDFDLGDDDPVPFWGLTRLPFVVPPLVELTERRNDVAPIVGMEDGLAT